jgi:hypothetical protein
MPIIVWLHGVPLEALGVTASTAGGLFGLARVWARSMFRRRRDRMQALLQELAEHVAQTAAQSSTEVSASQPIVTSPARAAEELPLEVSERARA